MKKYVPCTPGGTFVFDEAANTEKQAIKNLMRAASHMPYGTWENFKKRGYEIVEFDEEEMP